MTLPLPRPRMDVNLDVEAVTALAQGLKRHASEFSKSTLMFNGAGAVKNG